MSIVVSDRLNSTDTVFAMSGGPTIMFVLAFEGNGNDIDECAVENWISDRLGVSPILTHSIHFTLGNIAYPRWKKTSVAVREHVSITRSSGDGWVSIGRRLAQRAVMPMPMGKPPWRIEVFTNVAGVDGFPSSTTVVALQVHHAAADGAALTHLGRMLFGYEEVPNWSFKSSKAAQLRDVFHSLAVSARMIGALAKQWRESSKGLECTDSPGGSAPMTRLNSRNLTESGHGFVSFNLTDVKEIARGLDGSSVNDVMITIVAGALRDYLAGKGELPEGSLAVHIPVSTRRGVPQSGNQVVDTVIRLGTDIEDPIERISQIHSDVRRGKRLALRRVRAEIPAPILKLALKRRNASNGYARELFANTIISNVPRGNSNLSFFGMPVRSTLGVTSIEEGRGLGHLVSSIGDVLTLSVSYDLGMMPDWEVYRGLLQNHYRILESLATSKTAIN